MTYHIQLLVLESPHPPPAPKSDRAIWLDNEGVEHANVGTGVKKVWAEIFGSWGNFEPGSGEKKPKTKAVKKKAESVKQKVQPGEKVVKKIMMPMMPSRTTSETK
jgi:A/G-specific adenine glycosylase